MKVENYVDPWMDAWLTTGKGSTDKDNHNKHLLAFSQEWMEREPIE